MDKLVAAAARDAAVIRGDGDVVYLVPMTDVSLDRCPLSARSAVSRRGREDEGKGGGEEEGEEGGEGPCGDSTDAANDPVRT